MSKYGSLYIYIYIYIYIYLYTHTHTYIHTYIHIQNSNEQYKLHSIYETENLLKVKYLGTTLTNQNRMHKETKPRLNTENACQTG